MSFEDQTGRIERLIGLINSSNTGTAKELAQKMGVSRRTILSDLEYFIFRHFDFQKSIKYMTFVMKCILRKNTSVFQMRN